MRRGRGLQREWWGHAGGGHAVPVLPRLRKSDRRIFHTKASLQKLSAKVGSAGTARCPGTGTARGSVPNLVTTPHCPCPPVLHAAGRVLEAAGGRAERVRPDAGVRQCPPGPLLPRGAARRHAGGSSGVTPTAGGCWGDTAPGRGTAGVSQGWDRSLCCQCGPLPCPRGDTGAVWGSATGFPQALDGDLYERLRDHLSTAGQAEVETCRATQEWFQSVSEAATRVTPPVLWSPRWLAGGDMVSIPPPAPCFSPPQVCREQDLLLFLQDHAAFTLAPEQRFQLTGIPEVGLGGSATRGGRTP